MCCQHNVASSTDRTHKIDLVNQESTDKALFRSNGARRSQEVKTPDRMGKRQAKNKQGFKGWRDLEAR
ncbi:hypothetical protein QUB05_08385 [Microcoleus sp. F10-C6]|uniref:hypothetical protein n=1 Tax=unclassified Microcoleus TaxID=2642155 RepID=UPI002FD03D31